ncbi:MAG: hypothetical protein RLZZ603_786 [Actinomycetota bacterium]|jgi:hypothetical protein
MAKSSPRGASRVLVALYAVLALAATARGVYELIVKFQLAPLAYSLSLVSALVYIVATIALANATKPGWYRVARTTIAFELVGVICVGILSFSSPALFAHPSVWSWFGAGYGCLPLALPIFGLLWLRKHQAN